MEVDKKIIYKEIINQFSKLNHCYQKYSSKVSKNLDNADAIHDIRVTIRRILSLFELLSFLQPQLEIQDLKKRAKKVIAIFNNIRDFQVQLNLASSFAEEELNAVSFISYLREKVYAEVKKLKKTLKKGDLVQIEGDLFFLYLRAKDMLKETDIKFNRLVEIGREYIVNLIKQLNNIEESNYPTYHKTRLELKKFRYLMEIYQPIFSFESERLKELQNLQTILGTLQDHWVFYLLLREYMLSTYQSLAKISVVFAGNTTRLRKLEEEFAQNVFNLDFWVKYFN